MSQAVVHVTGCDDDVMLALHISTINAASEIVICQPNLLCWQHIS